MEMINLPVQDNFFNIKVKELFSWPGSGLTLIRITPIQDRDRAEEWNAICLNSGHAHVIGETDPVVRLEFVGDIKFKQSDSVAEQITSNKPDN